MRFLLVIAALLAAANVFAYAYLLSPPTLAIGVFAAGKGNVILIRTRDDQTLLIDTGSDASILRALGTALPFWQRSIDEVVLTSDKAAQAGGLSSLMSRYRVKKILHAGTVAVPYGSSIWTDGARFTLAAPGEIVVSAEGKTVTVSSSTPDGSLLK